MYDHCSVVLFAQHGWRQNPRIIVKHRTTNLSVMFSPKAAFSDVQLLVEVGGRSEYWSQVHPESMKEN